MTAARVLIVSVEEIRELGFDWPHPEIPRDFLAVEPDGRIDLGATIRSLRSEAREQRDRCARGRLFARAHQEQMSAYEYSGWKDHADGYLYAAFNFEQGIEFLRDIKVAIADRARGEEDKPDFYLELRALLEDRHAAWVVDQVVHICQSNKLAERTPASRRDSVETVIRHLDPYDWDGRRTGQWDLVQAYEQVLPWLDERGTG